jgi:hypothetical protein
MCTRHVFHAKTQQAPILSKRIKSSSISMQKTDTHVNWAATNSIHAQKSIEIPSIHVDFHTARLQPRLSKPGSVNVKGLRDTAFSKEKAAADLHVDRFSPKPACTEYLLSLRSRPDSLQACM